MVWSKIEQKCSRMGYFDSQTKWRLYVDDVDNNDDDDYDDYDNLLSRVRRFFSLLSEIETVQIIINI